MVGFDKKSNPALQTLKKKIEEIEGFRANEQVGIRSGIDSIDAAFPQGLLPTGAIHEIVPENRADNASGYGFTLSLMSRISQAGQANIWISKGRSIFMGGVSAYGIDPNAMIVVQARKDRDALEAAELALRSRGVGCVVAEISDADLTATRRLQLSVEETRATGFLIKTASRGSSSACSARWIVSSASSISEKGLPGIGFPRWNVELQKAKNGRPGKWLIEWRAGSMHLPDLPAMIEMPPTAQVYSFRS